MAVTGEAYMAKYAAADGALLWEKLGSNVGTRAAAVDGNSVWIASEYIAHACDYTTWGGRFFGAASGDNKLGTCAATPGGAGLRSALGNWSTRISKLTP